MMVWAPVRDFPVPIYRVSSALIDMVEAVAY
jgi:hypothetical protein